MLVHAQTLDPPPLLKSVYLFLGNQEILDPPPPFTNPGHAPDNGRLNQKFE